MKKLISIFCAMFLVFGTISMAKASDSIMSGFYVSPKMVYSFSDADLEGGKSDNKDGMGFALSAGYDFYKEYQAPARIELEYSIVESKEYKVENKKFADVDHAQVLMANVYYDFHNSSDFVPFVGAGIGSAFVDSETNFAWNVKAGVAYNLYDDLALELSYRYLDMGTIDAIATKRDVDFTSHDIMLGVRFTF